MLIKICPNLDFSDATKNYLLAMENLASAARNGDHAVIADIQTLETLSELNDLGLSARALFKTLKRKWTQLSSLESIVSKKIIAGEFNEIKKIKNQHGEEIHVPISMFDSRELSQKTKLILEDVGDELIYQLITDWFLKKKKGINNFSNLYNCNSVHGGGQRTGFVYKTIERKERCLTLCIVDTDKKYPTCDFGPTAEKVREAHISGTPLNQPFYLEVHEVENLIPISIYRLTYAKHPNDSALKAAYESLEFLEENSAIKFFDSKKGVSCLQINLTATDERRRDYWSPLVDTIHTKKDCNHKVCNQASCKNQMIKNWPKPAETKAEITAIRDGEQFEFNISPWLSNEWERIGQKILNWCLRYDSIST